MVRGKEEEVPVDWTKIVLYALGALILMWLLNKFLD